MPVPTAALFDKQQRTQTNGTHASNSAAHTTDQNNDSYFGTLSGSSASASHNAEAGRALTKEEADRLYEERMEEEYAKRDGGA